ncbi:hypothetical protein BP6252_10845 [Coleophoma cylindrospora]|uniref:Uncharacterized protein n=1 Tax=Coleophoma cylindrospora TaxID=1849047 RepID=A0A3D8QNT4_9HELO|nr:hypothetical protein BP6252_10845 [Coleophoma cylindrospora]
MIAPDDEFHRAFAEEKKSIAASQIGDHDREEEATDGPGQGRDEVRREQGPRGDRHSHAGMMTCLNEDTRR